MSDAGTGTSAGQTDPAPAPNVDSTNGEAAKWRRQLRDLEASLPGQLEQAKAAGHAEMTRHVVAAEVRARAAGRFTDPADALAFIGDDTAGLLTKDGMPDLPSIDGKLDELLAAKPHLAVRAAGFGSADQGARGGAKPSAASDDWVRTLIARKQ